MTQKTDNKKDHKTDQLRENALAYHERTPKGKLNVVASKPLTNQYDLSLAYSPGVAYACKEIVSDSLRASDMTARGNLVAVITDGSAVLGLGNIGPLAAKPVMEGKAVLFKKFGGINCFDIEVASSNPQHFCDVVASLEPTFGGINLEDIKAPECFYIETELKRRMNIPVFHDDQHGTAIIVAAGAKNAFELINKPIENVKIVCSGAGAAGLSCLNMLCTMGVKKENIWLFDRSGMVAKDMATPDEPRFAYARDAAPIDLEAACDGADMFLGCSAKGVLKAEMLKKMARDPIVFALANPDPEILPEDAKAARSDVIIATGRSDYPNQVNNVLCFPFVFRGALDVGATEINEHMKKACAESLADLAKTSPGEEDDEKRDFGQLFGREYLIPKPFDKRLILAVAPAVARAAMESGVALRHIEDWDQYRNSLRSFVYRSGTIMKPLFERAVNNPRRVVYAEGENPKVLRAVQTVLDEGLAEPVLVGRPEVIKSRVKRLGLDIFSKVEICNPEDDPRYRDYYEQYYQIMSRKGVSIDTARHDVRTENCLIALLMLKRAEADGCICGVEGRMLNIFDMVRNVIGFKPEVDSFSSMMILLLSKGTYFIADTHVVNTPNENQLFNTARLASIEIERFGMKPIIGMISNSNFGSRRGENAEKMAAVSRRLKKEFPGIAVEGEMQVDFALSPSLRDEIYPDMSIKGESVNLLVMPNIEAANIAYNSVKCLADATPIGPILLGATLPVGVVTTSTTVDNLVNMTTVVTADVATAGPATAKHEMRD